MSVASGEEGVRVCLGRVCGDRCRGLGLVCRCDVVWVVVGLRTSLWASWVKGLMVWGLFHAIMGEACGRIA